MQTLALISFLRAGGDYHRCRPRGPVFLLVGFPAAAAMAFERDGPGTDSLLALARAAPAKVRSRKRLVVERTGAPHFSVPSR
jgi:hypothetical protein